MTDRAGITEAIIVLRRRMGLNQKTLADRARISPAHMSRIERAKVEAKRPTLQRIATALGLSLAEFYQFCDDLAKSRLPEPSPPADTYPAHNTRSRRQPDAVAEEAKRVQYFFGLDDDDES